MNYACHVFKTFFGEFLPTSGYARFDYKFRIETEKGGRRTLILKK